MILSQTFYSDCLYLSHNARNHALGSVYGFHDWFMPYTGYSLVSFTLYDFLHEPHLWTRMFSRHELNPVYGVFLANAGLTNNQAMAVRMQSDYLSLLERAYRARHADTVRTRILPAGRLGGLSDPSFGVFSRMVGQVVDLLRVSRLG